MSTLLDALGAEILPTSWTCPSIYGPLTSPLVAAGDKLIGVVGKVVYAVDIHNGQQVPVAKNSDSRWVLEMHQATGTDPRVTACDGAVYLMDGDYLTAVRLDNGSSLPGWVAPKLGRASSLVADRGIILALYLDAKKGASRVAGYIAATGAKAFEPVEVAKSSAGPAGYGDAAVFFVAGGKLLAVNLRSGDTRWTFSDAQDKLSAATAPCAAEKVVLVAGRNLHGIGIDDGKERFRIAPLEEGNVNWHTPVIDTPAKVRTASKVVNLKAARPLLQGAEHLLQASDTDAASLAAGVAIATNSMGEVICLSLADGKIKWRAKVKDPGAPRIIDDVVYIKTDGGKQLARFYVESGRSAGVAYSLPNLASAQPAVITNGTLFLADDLGGIVARPFANQTAAYFDGVQSCINIRPDGTQFDFGKRNFTVEAWVRSSQGGDIISGYPTKNDPNANGFRLNLTPNGQIRVAIFSADGKRQNVGRTNASSAADGNWHHIALVRRNDTYLILLDGIPLEVRVPEAPGLARLAIGGDTALTIGALVSKQGEQAASFFNGLIREVRLWDCAMEASLVESNRSTTLIGTEPQLLGLWRLDEIQAADKAAVEPYNAAHQHRVKSQFINHASRRTDLMMDRNAFPYLLRESAKQWPYANTWGARGQTQVTGSSALSRNGILAFPTENVLYAVGAQDGKRKWAMDIAEKISDPVADGNSFLLLTQDDSLVRIDARTGQKTQLAAFTAMHHEHAEALPAPAANETYVAAATGDGNTQIVIAERQADTGLTVNMTGTPLQLAFCKTATNSALTVLTRTASELELHLIDCVTGLEIGKRSVTGRAYCIAGSWLFALSGDTVTKLDIANLAAAPLAISGKISDNITGMVASLDEDLLILATDSGKVLAYSLSALTARWETSLPPGPAGSLNGLNTPVFDRAARVICTAASGTIAVVNGKTGVLLGLYQAQNGTVGIPQVHAGTVYVGCHDVAANAQNAELDGAMHSLVLGDISALRLNLDRLGNPVANGTQHAVIDISTKDATLHLIRVQESCVEAWVNVPRLTGAAAARAGGGIVGIAASEESNFSINMWLDADGTVHYSSSARENGKWTGIHVKTQTSVMDGKWHHLAASRRPAAAKETAEQVILYVDGKAMPTVRLAEPPAPKVAPAGLKAYVGACVAADLRAEKAFCGMIAEVRIWDTYLVAPEIASRMLVKLRGDEPALLAYWNFDYQAVHDSALQGHSGVLAQEPTAEAPVWWLTDLPFTQPAYPHITSTASISRMKDNVPLYALTAKVCAADGSGMAGKRVEMWYIKRQPDDPASIFINGTEVLGIKPGSEPDPVLRAANITKVFSAVTGSDGTLDLSISSPEPGHGPSLDLWTSFMPVNERFHINVLINNQVLAKPVPPTLTAQAKLIQDYHYTTGDKINDQRDRSTWRVVLRSRESDGGLCMREPITLWASKPASIEIAGKKYEVNTERSVTVDSEMNGDMTIIMEADELTSPSLYARAGFMNRNERIIISPDQDAQQQLSTIESDDMTKPRVTNWKKEGGGEDSMLNPEHKDHAGDISKAVRHVASSAKADNNHAMLKARMSPAQLKLMAMRAAEKGIDVGLLKAGENGPDLLRIDAMQQDEAGAKTDRVTLLRTVAGAPRLAPANPDAFRRSIGGALGFVIEAGGPNGYSYRTLHTHKDVMLARGVATPVMAHAPHLLGNIFEDAWNTVKDVATDIYEGAKTIVVTVADAVQVAITKVVDGINSVVHAVVSTVEDALNAVAGFFEQLAVAIKKVIAFLRALFDWGAILEAQRILHDMFRLASEVQKKAMKDKAGMTRIARMIAGLPTDNMPAGGPSLNASSSEAKNAGAPALAGADGVQANSMLQKSNNSSPRPLEKKDPSGTMSMSGSGDSFEAVIEVLPGLAKSILDLSPSDLVAKLQAALSKSASTGLESLAGHLGDACGAIGDGIDGIMKLFDTPVYIPFVSELYKWITGEELSLLSLICLGLGVFFNTLYAFVTLPWGEPRSFASDAKGLPARWRSQAGLAPKSSLPSDTLSAGEHDNNGKGAAILQSELVPGTPLVVEVLYVGFNVLKYFANLLSDEKFQEMAVRDGRRNPWDNMVLAMAGIMQGLAGIGVTCTFTFGSQPAFHARLEAVLGSDRKLAKRREWMVYLSFSILTALSLKKAVKGVITCLDGGLEIPPNSATWTGKIKLFFKDHEYKMLRIFGVLSAALIVYLLVDFYELSQDEFNRITNDNVKEEYKLLLYRDVMGLVPVTVEFMFTDEYMKKLRSMGETFLYSGAISVRSMTTVVAIILHGVAVFKYGDIELK